MLRDAAESQRRGVIANDGDAHCGGRRHQISVLYLQEWRREAADLVSPGRVEAQRADVALTGFEAFDELAGSGKLRQHDRERHMRSKRAHDLHPRALQFSCCGVLGILRGECSEPDFASSGEVSNARVRRLLRDGGSGACQQTQHRHESPKTPFHESPPWPLRLASLAWSVEGAAPLQFAALSTHQNSTAAQSREAGSYRCITRRS